MLRPDSLEPTHLPNRPGHEEVKNLVGNWLTIAPTPLLPGHTMYVDDEALLGGESAINFLATMLYNTGHPICGVVVIVSNSHASNTESTSNEEFYT